MLRICSTHRVRDSVVTSSLMCCAMVAFRWADLPSVDQDTASRAAKLRTQLSGDPAFQYTLDDPAGQAAADADSEGSKLTMSEVQRLRCMIDSVNQSTAVQPKVWRRR